MRPWVSPWALALALLPAGTLGVTLDVPRPENYVRRIGMKAIVLGNYVYIDGGEVSQVEVGTKTSNSISEPVNSTLSIDISKSWSAGDVQINTIARHKDSPVMFGQSLWGAGNTFHIYGGHSSYGRRTSNISKTQHWRFDADGNGGGTWSQETAANQQLYASMDLGEYGAFTTAGDTGFHFGGERSMNTEPGSRGHRSIAGVLSYNMTTKMWRNDSSSGMTPLGTLTLGQAAFVPAFGPNGLIFVMGGASYTQKEMSQSAQPDSMPEFRNVKFMDPVTKKWYSQETSGTPPDPRQSHCLVGVQGKNGTYEIFMFGGTRKTAPAQTFDDVWILSLPGFAWTRAGSIDRGGPRSNHHCVVIGKRQMLSIGGGRDSDGFPTVWTSPDSLPNGLAILDMTDLTWSSQYDAKAGDYESPKTVKEWYAQGKQASVTWSSDEVQKLFAVENKSGLPGSGGVSDGDNPDSQPTDPKSTTPIGAIVGGVVGGLAVLAVIAAVVFFMKRRKRKASNPAGELADTEWKQEAPGSESAPSHSAVSPGYHELSVKPPAGEMPVWSEATGPQSGPSPKHHEMGVRPMASELWTPPGDPPYQQHPQAAELYAPSDGLYSDNATAARQYR